MRTLQKVLIICGLAVLLVGCSNLADVSYNPWKQVNLPTDEALVDVAFTDDPQHGWVVGSRATLFETMDGGKSWQPYELELGEEKESFTSVSFVGQEGWVVGRPSILLHTEDGGEHWTRIALSEKLPGSPYSITALGDDEAEMTTDVGAIYRTDDRGQTWHALVQDAVGVVRNISRSPQGDYIAVSARGNFYSTWHPGDESWQPHQRNSSRRLQNMGYGEDDRRWLIARGGQIQFSASDEPEDWDEVIYPEPGTSWGLLDVAYRTPEEIWVSGGSANLLVSFDGGETWEKDRKVEDVPSNFYKIVFLNAEKGFILGDRGVLLRYEPPTETAAKEA
ncbi:photosynthesis system II assembly factor Ycf48 [Spirulina sp. CS-785/01]|nr:photosynthesis system II assembly factor Ycf48 [Spirulina sp. CS-785/01]